MSVWLYLALIIATLDILIVIACSCAVLKQRRKNEELVNAITSYQRGDMDPWDARYEKRSKAMRRHGYTFNRKYHEDPWEVGVPR